MKKKVLEVTNRVKNKNNPTVYDVVGFGKYGDYTAGKDTFISQLTIILLIDRVQDWQMDLKP